MQCGAAGWFTKPGEAGDVVWTGERSAAGVGQPGMVLLEDPVGEASTGLTSVEDGLILPVPMGAVPAGVLEPP